MDHFRVAMIALPFSLAVWVVIVFLVHSLAPGLIGR
jgi:hypothetical protein